MTWAYSGSHGSESVSWISSEALWLIHCGTSVPLRARKDQLRLTHKGLGHAGGLHFWLEYPPKSLLRFGLDRGPERNLASRGIVSDEQAAPFCALCLQCLFSQPPR